MCLCSILCDRFDDWFTIKFINTRKKKQFLLSLQFFRSIATHRMLRDARESSWASDWCAHFYDFTIMTNCFCFIIYCFVVAVGWGCDRRNSASRKMKLLTLNHADFQRMTINNDSRLLFFVLWVTCFFFLSLNAWHLNTFWCRRWEIYSLKYGIDFAKWGQKK